jgi:hypothetical protein
MDFILNAQQADLAALSRLILGVGCPELGRRQLGLGAVLAREH